MKIVQILSHLNKYDAIGSNVLAIHEELQNAGYQSKIMALTTHSSLKDKAQIVLFDSIRRDDLVILHKAMGDVLTRSVCKLQCCKGMIYHNITPAHFYMPYDPILSASLMMGRVQLIRYAPKMDFGWGDSRYNCQELVRYGMDESKVAHLPLLLGKRDTGPVPDKGVELELDSREGTKLLFIGRIAPNKKFEDIIKAYWYVVQRDPLARLFLVGSWQGTEKYYAKLKGFCADLGLSDEQVVFTGPVSEEEKEAFLRGADVMVCMSEHEGFCVPLVEAMQHDLPVVAYEAAAVHETLGDNGLLFEKKDFTKMADAALRVTNDSELRGDVLELQRFWLQRANQDSSEDILLKLVRQELERAERRLG